MSHQDLVRAFHTKFGVPVRDKPGVPSDERVNLRLGLFIEEGLEKLEAASDLDDAFTAGLFAQVDYWLHRLLKEGKRKVDLPAFVDALADLEYVILGSGVELGVDLDPVFREVDRSNKTKSGGGVREDGKLLKGPDYEPPRVLELLKAQGWEP